MAFSRRDFLIRSTGFVTVSAMVPALGRGRGRSRFEESVGAANRATARSSCSSSRAATTA